MVQKYFTEEERKEARREQRRKRYIKNSEKEKTQSKEWQKNNPEKAKAHTAKYELKHPEKVKERKKLSGIKIKYGLSLQQWEKILENQGGKCAICGREEKIIKEIPSCNNDLCVDHDHSTGEIRGLLCDFCNRCFLGSLEKNIIDIIGVIEALKNLPAYLIKEHHYGIVPNTEQAKRRRREI